MILSINQPAYLPWLGYFERINRADLHVVLDHVQFEKNSLTNRNKIRTREGWSWLSVPVQTKGHFGDLAIAELKTAADTRWRAKHWKTLQACYGKAPHFAVHADFFAGIYSREWPQLNALLTATNDYLCRALGVATPVVHSSDREWRCSKSALVLEICQAYGADVYLSGPFGRSYLELDTFAAAGVRVCFHDFEPPVYPQCHAGFEPGLSAVDGLFSCGGAGEFLKGGIDDLPTD